MSLDISKAFDRMWYAGLLHKLKNLKEFDLISSFLSNSFRCFWMGGLQKRTQSVLEFLKVPFLDLYFSYYKVMILLMILSLILLSMLMILLSTLSVIIHLICGSN